MNDMNKDGKNSKAIVKKDRGETVPQLRELLQKPLDYLSPKQKGDLVGKAAEIGLEIEADRAQKKLKHESGWADVDRTVESHHKMSHTSGFTGHKITGDFEVASGRVRIDATKGAKCFVATAAFGDETANEVVFLRKFRDKVLRNKLWGCQFIKWYYYRGPLLAGVVIKHKWLKTFIRIGLKVFVISYSVTDKLLTDFLRNRKV